MRAVLYLSLGLLCVACKADDQAMPPFSNGGIRNPILGGPTDPLSPTDGGVSGAPSSCVSKASSSGFHFVVETNPLNDGQPTIYQWLLNSVRVSWDCPTERLTIQIGEDICENPLNQRFVEIAVQQANIAALPTVKTLEGPATDPLSFRVNRLSSPWGNCVTPQVGEPLYGDMTFLSATDADGANWSIETLLNLRNCLDQDSVLTLLVESRLNFTLPQSFATACAP